MSQSLCGLLGDRIQVSNVSHVGLVTAASVVDGKYIVLWATLISAFIIWNIFK